MNKDDIIYLFSGFGVEYSLGPLASYMKDNGFNVIELDMAKVQNAKQVLKGLKDKKLVYITSWHLFFDAKNFSAYYLTENEVFSPLEIIDYLKPIKSFYYPHDIGMFLHSDEWRWLDLFDAALLPYKNNDYYFIQQYTNVYDVGWIKKWKSINKRPLNYEEIKILYLPSNIVYHMNKYSIKEYGDMYKELLKRCDGVKFPSWPGIEVLEQMVKDNGGKVIENEKTMFEVIEDYDLVIATGASGVVDEASNSGWPVISVLDGALTDEEYKRIIPNNELIYTCSIEKAVRFIDELRQNKRQLTQGKSKIEVFNVELVMEIITKF